MRADERDQHPTAHDHHPTEQKQLRCPNDQPDPADHQPCNEAEEHKQEDHQ